MEFKSILNGNIGRVVADYVIVLRVEMSLVGQGGFRLIVDILYSGIGKLHKIAGYYVTRKVHSR